MGAVHELNLCGCLHFLLMQNCHFEMKTNAVTMRLMEDFVEYQLLIFELNVPMSYLCAHKKQEKIITPLKKYSLVYMVAVVT